MTTYSITPHLYPSAAELELPGSKSEVNRLLVLAALSGREVTVEGVSASDDVRYMVSGIAALGYLAQLDAEGRTIRVGPRQPDAPTSGEMFCGNAGTAVRFLVSLAAITPGNWTVTGDERMQTRPMQPLIDAWRQLGVVVTRDGKDLRVVGARPAGGKVLIDGSVSSQFVSSLLLIGAALPSGVDVELVGPVASRGFLEWTIKLIQRFGVGATLRGRRAFVEGGYGDVPASVRASADWSAMGVWTCLNHLTGGRVRGRNLKRRSGQPDEWLDEALRRMQTPASRTIDVSLIPDQFLNLACLAAMLDGTTRLIGAANVRVKECDRVAVVTRELRKCGADVTEHEDGLTVRGGAPLHGVTVDPEGDHRVAMAFALLGARVPDIDISEPDCVSKSYPGFWRDLEKVRELHLPVALVGMRGAGKSTLGRALATHLGADFVDSDEEFAAQHGPISPFVAARGWPAFREKEAQVIKEELLPGRVLALGGGALETAAVRERLRQRAIVIYLEAAAALLRERIDGSDRPTVTGAPIVAEVDDLVSRRAPLFQAAADRTIDASLQLQDQVTAAAAALSLEHRS